MDPTEPRAGHSWREGIEGEPRRGGPLWRREDAEAVPSTGIRSRKAQLLLAFLGLGLFGGLLVWVSFWLWPFRSAGILLIGSGYDTNLALPAHIYGWQALHDLADLTQNNQLASFWGSRILRLKHAPRQLQVGDAWDHDLDSVGERTVVVYLALHGGADSKGGYLLPGNATVLDQPENRLRLDAIIRRFGALPANKHKLLILDSTAIANHWSLGILENDFARELAKLEKQIVDVPNLVVLSASGPDQRSWSSPQWRQTIFGHYLIEGLKGGAGDEDGDNRSSVLDLYHYLQANVENWVWSNRQAWQTPVLLPSAAVGEERARQIDLSFVRPYEPPTAEKTPVFQPPQELLDAWMVQQRMIQQVPPPAAYAPPLWRQYQDTLLRYEELLRGEALASAATMRNRLADLAQELDRVQRLGLTSIQNTLAMPAAAGFVMPAAAPDTRRKLDDLWNAAPADYSKTWKALLAAAPPPGGERALRYDTYQYLLDRSLDDPAGNLARVATLLQVINDPTRPKPVEAQYAAFLARDLATPPPPADLVQLGLRVMIRGEQTALASQAGLYPYSEQVYPWLQATVEQADQQRRLGQDLLFASEPAAWERARRLLQQADELYQQAQSNGSNVRAALTIRDQSLMRLPYYSHWIADRRIFDDPHHLQEDNRQLQGLLGLWKDCHELASLLANPDAKVLLPSKDRRSLGQIAETLRAGFVALEQDFQKEALSLADFDLQSIQRHSENLLHVPYLEPNLRMQILTNLDRSSQRLLVQMSQNVKQVRPLDSMRYRNWYKHQAQQQGQLALAALGQSWFDQCAGPDGENYLLADRRLQTFLVEPSWWVSLARVGEGVGRCYSRLPAQINQEVETAKTAKLADARAGLQVADLLCRQITGAESLLLTSNPTDSYRRACMVGLLFWQAERTLHDHWFAVESTAEPYYRVTAQLCINDARQLDPRPLQGEAKQEFQELQKRLEQPGKLVLAGPTRRDLTSDQPARFLYQVQPAENAWLPSGYPVFWIQPGKELVLVSPADANRLVRRVGMAPGDDPTSLSCEVVSPLLQQAETNPPATPQPEPTTLRFLGVFRGQRIEQSTRVNLYPLPDIAVRTLPPPQTGSVAVRAAKDVMSRFGASTGHIAIVLDCTGSMAGVSAGSTTTKYAEALAALRQVLQQLPKGATVSLWVFGQRTTQPAALPEDTITPIQKPIVWDPQDANQLKAVMAKVESLTPWNETPLVRALVRAKADLQEATGFKTIVALTDGMDNRFATDLQFNPTKKDIPTFLTETFRDSGILLNIVGYKVVSQEAKQAEAQFKVVESWPLPGMFLTVSDVKTLSDSLGHAMSQSLHYWVDREDNVPMPGPKGGVTVSAQGANDQWFPGGLPAALYKLRVLTDQRLLQNIAINRGDLLLVNLQQGEKGIRFERGLWSTSDFPWKPSASKQDWRLSALQNQAVGDRGLQMLLALEKAFDPREATLEVLRPRQSWIEVSPGGAEGRPAGSALPAVSAEPFAVRWGYLHNYPAPVWGLDVPRWPGGQPVVRVWWNPDQELVPATKLDPGADFQSVTDLPGRAVPVEGDPVRIDSVSFEDHLVEVRPGTMEKQPCLVVRLSHAAGKPVTVRALGLAAPGQEHRFYTQIGQYTALFWPVSKESVAKELTSFAFYSLAAFKRDAERRGFYLEMNNLKLPEASDVRPRMPIQLK